MTTREDIDKLLSHIRELERVATGVYEKETVPASFFSQAFGEVNHIINALRLIEQGRVEQIEKQLQKQLACVEEITARIKSEEEKIKELAAMAQSPVQEVIPEAVPLPDVEVVPELPVAEIKAEPAPVPAVKQGGKQTLSVYESLEKKNLADLRKSFSLNDRFLFKKELFGGDEDKMSRAINDLNGMPSLQDAMAYVNTEMNWDNENTVVADFMSRLEKRFN